MTIIVSLVLDPHFSDKLYTAIQNSFVWICSSSENDNAVNICRDRLKQAHDDRTEALTTFKYDIEADLSQVFTHILFDIQEHQKWDILRVYGLPLTVQLEKLLLLGCEAVILSANDYEFTASKV